MAIRAAVIENGKVTNLIVVSSLTYFNGVAGAPTIVDPVGKNGVVADIGHDFDGNNFAVPVPTDKQANALIDQKIQALEGLATTSTIIKAVVSGDKSALTAIDTQIAALKALKK